MSEFYNIKITINKELSAIRLDKVLTKKIDKFSRSQIKILIQNGNVKKNNKIFNDSSYLVKEGDSFDINIIESKTSKYKPENIKLDIIYEDSDLIIINKQSGIVTHPAPGNETGTLVQALLNHTANKLSTINGDNRPGIVHRLDKDTSGLMVIAKNNFTHEELSKQFKDHTITRKYHALVWGVPKSQTIEGYIERNKINRKKMSFNKKGMGKFSKTDLKLKQSFGNSSIVECKLYTGRTHQVRLHLTSINTPLLGDKLYGKNKVNQFGKDKENFNKFLILKNFSRQALHASHLGFFHPTLKKNVEFNSKIPEDISNLIKFLVKY